jgi:hypothetical protein
VNSNQRTEFKELLEKLYAGFNMPISEARIAAYWEGLSKMSLGNFALSVEYALGENGPERIPAVPAIWKISKGLRASAPSPPLAPREDHSRALKLVNGLFLKYLLKRRVTEGFKGNINLGGRRTACLDLIQWIGAWDERELKSEFVQIKRLFDEAMARIPDRQAAA